MGKFKDIVIVAGYEFDYNRYTLEGLPNCYSLYDNVADEFIIDNVNADPDLMDHEDNIPGGLAYMLMLLMNEDNGLYLFEVGGYLQDGAIFHCGFSFPTSAITKVTTIE